MELEENCIDIVEAGGALFALTSLQEQGVYVVQIFSDLALDLDFFRVNVYVQINN